ncbi:hypothetical protein [Amycolatopsis vancoresmycina]|uniref:Uncharacterized protein n=1 Tax=Amycolatopsis vancoresmycina DSM 44592 TaxID=1292037 RepID=R1G7J3_9PSEU|nr:hypothetical protein [Amycolatopsis vancoresmycina]EOD67388.1 hypothetical protein H480_16710 [Amycolatopsis vancoresmycina DSM 44592]
MNRMWARSGALAAVAIAAAALATGPAQAATGRLGWQATLLPLPAGADPAGHGYLDASDGHGEYTGSFIVDGKLQVISWRGGQPTLRGVPAGYEWARVVGEDTAGRIYGEALDYDTGADRTFTLDATGFHLWAPPPGYGDFGIRAVNRHGDALGTLPTGNPVTYVPAVWPAGAAAPTVLAYPAGADYLTDIDDDGTVLFNGFQRDIVWKNGVSRPLADIPGFSNPHGSAIRNGVVVGFASNANAEQAIRWTTPETPAALPGGGYAIDLNVGGLTAGQTSGPGYKPIVWRGTTPGGELKQPGTYTGYLASHVTDDGVFTGWASNGPIDEGGVPVIWRFNP